MKKISANLFLILILTFGLSLSVLGQETITLTTFYPSPVGVYQDLLVTRGMAIGDTDGDGDVDAADLPLDNLDNPTEGFLVNTGVFFLGGGHIIL